MEKVELHPEIKKLKKYIKNLSRSEVNEELLQMYLIEAEYQRKLHELQRQLTRSNQSYMANCRSSGGVTLPPGM